MAKSKLVKLNETIAEGVVGGYKKIEEGVVGGYKKMENGVVGGFTKMTDKFVDQFLTREGESVEEAKKRLAEEQAARRADARIKAGTCAGPASDAGRASVEGSRNAGKKDGSER